MSKIEICIRKKGRVFTTFISLNYGLTIVYHTNVIETMKLRKDFVLNQFLD